MVELTKMEKQALDAITKDDFYEDGLNSAIWADVYLDTVKGFYGIDSKKARGVLGSLVKKGIINGIIDEKDRFGRSNGAISFTAKGKEVMRELGYND